MAELQQQQQQQQMTETEMMDDDQTVGEVPLKNVEIKIKRQPMPDAIAREYAFVPTDGSLLIEAPKPRPPLLVEDACKQVAQYDLGPEFGGSVNVDLRLRSAPDNGESFDISIPMRMLQYKTPEDPKMCFDVPTCHRVDSQNEVIIQHNRYLASLLSIFIRDNGCGTSAGHVTTPSPPDVLALTRIKRLENIFKDKYASTILAIRYLAERGILCSKDYDVEQAVQRANDEAYAEGVYNRIKGGRIRFRVTGGPPANWSGDEGERDSRGRRVRWVRGAHHSFISPEISVGLALDEIMILPS